MGDILQPFQFETIFTAAEIRAIQDLAGTRGAASSLGDICAERLKDGCSW